MDLKIKIIFMNRFSHHTNMQSKTEMVSACVKWKSAMKQFFADDKGLRINSKIYEEYLEKELLPEVNRIMNSNTWILFKITLCQCCSRFLERKIEQVLY